MSTLENYLQLIDARVVSVAVAFALIFTLFVRGNAKLWVALFVLPLWLGCSRLPGLGMVGLMAKATLPAFIAIVAFSAMMYRSPYGKREIPWPLWLLPPAGLVGIFSTGLDDSFWLGVILGASWFLMMVANLFIVWNMPTETELLRAFRVFAMGCVFASAVPILSFFLPGGQPFATGLGRYTPFGGNPNQVGTTLMLGAILGTYLALTTRSIWRLIWFAFAALGATQAVITASRSVVFTLAIASIPLALMALRRPLFAILLSVAMLGSIAFVFSQIDTDVSFARLGNLESGRWITAEIYLRWIAANPIGGTLLTSSRPGTEDHPHNAFIGLLYEGGLLLFLPMLIFTVQSVWAGFRNLFDPRALTTDRVFKGLEPWLVVAMVAHGFTTLALFHSTFSWAFAFILLGSIAIATRAACKQDAVTPVPVAAAGQPAA